MNKIKHLEFIEEVVSRMAKNSFMLKGWSITITTLAVALLSKSTNYIFVLLLLLPTLTFWGLDSYYLLEERKYRFLYETICKIKKDEDIDFNMSTKNIMLSVDKSKKLCFLNCLFSKTELLFYLPLASIIVIMFFILRSNILI